MSPEEYDRNVLAAYQGEAYGEALFEALAVDAGDPEVAHKWRVLARLETETKERLIPLVRRIAGDDGLAPLRTREAVSEAADRRGLSWAKNMAIHGARAPGLKDTFEAMLAVAPDGDRAAIEGLLDHSLGFFAAVEREIAGETDGLAPVIDILERPPVAP